MSSSSSSVLLLLLIFSFIHPFTTQMNERGPTECCFGYFTPPIPIKDIKGYEETRADCSKPAIIFTLVDRRRMCVNPEAKWVQRHVKRIEKTPTQTHPDITITDQHQEETPTQTHPDITITDQHQEETPTQTHPHGIHGPGECCFSYFKGRIPTSNITAYVVTRPDCPQPGIIFTLVDGHRHVCVDPGHEWVQQLINRTDQHQEETPTQTHPDITITDRHQEKTPTRTHPHNSNGPDQCCFDFFKYPIPERVIRKYKTTRLDCVKDGVIFVLQNNRSVCADPGMRWVKRLREKIDQRLFTSSK